MFNKFDDQCKVAKNNVSECVLPTQSDKTNSCDEYIYCNSLNDQTTVYDKCSAKKPTCNKNVIETVYDKCSAKSNYKKNSCSVKKYDCCSDDSDDDCV